MSSRKVISKSSNAGNNNSPKGRIVSESSSPDIDQVTQDVSDISLENQGDGGWEVYVKKSKNKAGSSTGKQWAQQSSNPKVWGHPDVPQKLGMRNTGTGRGGSNNLPALGPQSGRSGGRGTGAPQCFNQASDSNLVTAVAPPLKHGWNWASRPGSTQHCEQVSVRNQNANNPYPVGKETVTLSEADCEDDDSNDSNAGDFDDDILSDEFDSDSSVKSHETRKKNRLLKELFECMDDLTVEQINDTERQWHCPACKGGPGAIDWYRGLQPLVAHAEKKGSTRVKLHRELAQLLKEELRRRGTSAVPAGEMFGKWQGLVQKAEKDIVWPPMVVIMNTILDKDDNDKWIGMGNQELLDYFGDYAAVKARHSYGPQGHRGMSLLIFEASAVGYLEAERLGKHFEDESRDRVAWERNRVRFYPGGTRQLYGYMAEKRDLDHFNQHCQGKTKLRFDIKSYQEMVVEQLKQMSEDNQQLLWFKNRLAKEQRHSKAVEESYGLVSEQYRKTSEENRLLKLRTKMHHEQNKEEMDFQEQFFKDQLKVIYDARKTKEDDFEKVQQEQRERLTQTNTYPSTVEDPHGRAEEIAKSLLEDKEMQEFIAQRGMLIELHEERMQTLKNKHLEEEMALKQRHYEEEVAVENEFDTEQSKLMEKYMPSNSRSGPSQ